jgi:hypothetical protein
MNSRKVFALYFSFSALLLSKANISTMTVISELSGYYSANPLNINRATVSDIYSLPYIDEVTAERISQWIEANGAINDLSILVKEGILEEEYAGHLKNMVIFDQNQKISEKGEYSVRFKRRLERSRAYDEEKYLGNPSQFTHKLVYSSAGLSFNAILDKEPGEINYTDNMKGNIIFNQGEKYRVILGGFSPSSYTGMLQNEGFSFEGYGYSSSSKFHDFTKTTPSSTDYAGYNGASAYKSMGTGRITAFWGVKNISSTLNGAGEIETVNLYAYTRTLTEIGRYHNSGHRIFGAAWEGRNSGLRYGASVSKEEFDKDIASGSKLEEGVLGELGVSGKAGEWAFSADIATDFNEADLKLSGQTKLKDMTADFYYGYIQKDRFAFSSSGIMLGNGEEEQVFGMKFKLKPAKDIVVISDNLIFYSTYGGTDLPGTQFSLKTSFKAGKTSFEPSFRYKYSEKLDNNFVSEERGEYNTRLKIIHQAGDISLTTDLRYTDDTNGGYGYLIGPALNYRSRNFRLRIGGDIYYTKNGAIVYAAYADTGKFPSLSSFSGQGRKTYIMAGYSKSGFELSAGIARHTIEDGDTFGSGYDLIDSGTVHTAEANFRFIF